MRGSHSPWPSSSGDVEVVPARQRYAAAVVRARPSSCARPAHDVAVIMLAHRSNGLTGDFACDEKQELDVVNPLHARLIAKPANSGEARHHLSKGVIVLWDSDSRDY